MRGKMKMHGPAFVGAGTVLFVVSCALDIFGALGNDSNTHATSHTDDNGTNAVTVLKWTGQLPSPTSDVEVTSHIGWWAYQDGLTVTGLAVTAVNPGLHLHNKRLLLRIQISGSMGKDSMRNRLPSIREVHVAEFFEYRTNVVLLPVEEDPLPGTAHVPQYGTNEIPVACYVFTPVLAVTKVKGHGGAVPFNVKVEFMVEAFMWGRNEFRVRCGGLERCFSVHDSP